ncbi:MAG: hypothetical protein ACAH80_17530 [Alphaproteobacteria bacterium]
MNAAAKKLKDGWDRNARPVRTLCDGGVYKWLVNGEPHREDGPAVEYKNGSKEWHLYGQLHREDGPAIEFIDGYRAWFINGLMHREDGPAIMLSDGMRGWYINGVPHRVGAPAIEFADGDVEYWNNGTFVCSFQAEQVASYEEAHAENKAFDRRVTEQTVGAIKQGVAAPLNIRRPLRFACAAP